MVPKAILASAYGRQVLEIGMGAGPGCIAQRTIKYEPPISVTEALQRLEAFRSVMKIGRILLDDRRTWFFDVNRFQRERRDGEK